jgi:putative DNA primase/helicase
MSDAERIARALDGKRITDGFLCRCPVPNHGKGNGDRNRSLIVKDGERALLFKCFAGCNARDVIDVLRRRGLIDVGSAGNLSRCPRHRRRRQYPPRAGEAVGHSLFRADAMTVRFDMTNIARALTARAAEVAIAVLGEPNRQLSSTRELRFGRKGSLAVVTDGTKAGWWYDHENGNGGDIIDLIERVRGVNFRDAVACAVQFNVSTPVISPTPAAPARPADDDMRRKQRRAGELLRESVPIVDTAAERYLASRGIVGLPVGVDGAVLRFHPACPFGDMRVSCMVAIMRDIRNNEPRAIYRTALTPTAEKIGRMALGPKTGAAVKLSSDEDVTQGLAVGEGVETVLSAMRLGFCPAWALGDAGNVRDFPLLSGIDCISIIVDNDENGTGQRAALECSRRWTEAGREVFRVIPDRCGDDMNELIQRARRKAPPRVRKPSPLHDQFLAPTPDLDGYRTRLREAFGNTMSDEFVEVMLGKVVEALKPSPHDKLDEPTLNAALAIIDSVQCRSELEAFIAVEIVATGFSGFRFLRQSHKNMTEEYISVYGNYANKLLRLQLDLMQALDRHQRGQADRRGPARPHTLGGPGGSWNCERH